MDLPKRKKNRLPEFHYNSPNAYFITICTAKRGNVLWTDVGAIIDRPCDVPLNEKGRIVDMCIREIPAKYPAILLEHYVIMPDHVHLLLQICTDCDGRSMIAPTISELMRQTKGAVSKKIGQSLWQKGFYDHVVRSEADYRQIWNYIEGNPGKRDVH